MEKRQLREDVPIISGDQCSWWDAPLKLVAAREQYPDLQLQHFVHDADTVGVPTPEFKAEMESSGREYAIALEGEGARWTSGAIMVPSRCGIQERGEKFRGVVATVPDEILASLDAQRVPELWQVLRSPGICHNGTKIGTGFSEAATQIAASWTDAMGIGGVAFGSSYSYLRSRRTQYLSVLERWDTRHSEAYNLAASACKIGMLSLRRGELPCFFVFREDGKLIRRRAYRKNGEWRAYLRNDPRPIRIHEVEAIVPKALLLGVLLRSEGYVITPKTGSAYLEHSGPIAEALGLYQYPMLRVGLVWRGFNRPFVSWIFQEEGINGLRRVAKEATIEVVD